MHNNYYFLRHLSKALNNKISGFELTQCFSQNKDELILSFKSQNEQFFIKSYLNPSFCCLSFPENFNRARKNSVDLFQEVIGEKIEEIEQFDNERVFSINLTSDYRIIFKMFGNRSNVLLAKEETIQSIFINRLSKDFSLTIEEFNRPIGQTKEDFLLASANAKKVFPTFGKEITSFLTENKFEELKDDEKWELIQVVLQKLSQGVFYYSQDKFSLLPFPDSVSSNSAIEALNEFFLIYISSKQLLVEKTQVLNQLKSKIKNTQSYILKTSKKLEEIEHNTNYQMLGDILMANLHHVKKGEKKVELSNFYDGGEKIVIPLKLSLTPQKNAEIFYKKSKNQNIEINKLKQNLNNKISLKTELENQYIAVSDIQELKSLRNYLKIHELIVAAPTTVEHKPYNEYTYQGFRIWVGKSAQNNDKMLKQAYKDDLWLHAKDVAGSHVIIKYHSSTPFSNQVKEKAAQLAAYYSKRKTDSLCPVTITPKKFVRKRKGDPAGAVIVEKENVILVEPRKWI